MQACHFRVGVAIAALAAGIASGGCESAVTPATTPDVATPRVDATQSTPIQETPPTVAAAARMHATVEFLAAREMRGRGVGSPENRRAGEWVANRFADVGLMPLVDGSFFHEFRGGSITGRNVAGVVRAKDDAADFVVVGAHYDGVGDIGTTHRPAADDNASGVAALLEIAKVVFDQHASLRRHVVFVAFDAEEVGLIGSTQFVLDEVIPSDRTKFMIVFDLIGGRFFPWQEKAVIAMGTEHSTYVRAAVEELCRGRPTPVKLLGTYVLEPAGPILARSDYRAYRKAKVPYVFFSTGTPWYYHMPEDGIEQLDFMQVAEIAEFAGDLVLRVARDTTDVDFVNRPKPEILDLSQLHQLLDEILEHRSDIRLPATKFDQMQKLRDSLARAIERGKASTILAHRALMLIFEAAKNSRPKPR